MDLELLEEVHHVRVGAEEDVQARLDPVAVRILPGGDLAAEHLPPLVHRRRVPGVHQVLGAGEAAQPTADHGDRGFLSRLLRELRNALAQRGRLAVVGRFVDARRRGVAEGGRHESGHDGDHGKSDRNLLAFLTAP